MKKPLIYYTMSLILGIVFAFIYKQYFLLCFLVPFIFIYFIFAGLERYEIAINIIFFVLGFYSIFLYFNIDIQPNSIINIRVLEKKNFDYLCDYKGRKIILLNHYNKDLQEGEVIRTKGEFILKPIYENGIVGEYKLKEICSHKKDFVTILYRTKEIIKDNLYDALGEKNGAVVYAVCFGDTSGITKEDMESLKNLGIIHVVSVSGFHIAIVYKFIELVLGMKFAIVLSLIYVLFTGAKASTMRAFVMIAVLKLSKKFRRNYDKFSALSLAAMLLLLTKPYYILDLGFVLSFLSTLGIMVYYTPIKRKFYKLPTKLNEAISITLSAQVFAMPYVIFSFESFNLGFFIGNLVLLPLYSALVILGNIGTLFIPLTKIFKAFMGITDLILGALNGGIYVLGKICPQTSYLTYLDGLIVIAIYMNYILFKHKRIRATIFPLTLLVLVFMENYSFVPVVNYFKVRNSYFTILQYKGERIMIGDKGILSKDKYILDKFAIDKVVNKSNFKLSDNKLKKYDIILSENDKKDEYFSKPRIIKKLYFINGKVYSISL